MGLVSLDVAKGHLKPPGDVDDVRIERIIDEASAIVLDYIKKPFDSYHTTSGELEEESVPPNIRAAVLLVCGSLYDNADGQDPDKNPMSPAVISLLYSSRMLTLR